MNNKKWTIWLTCALVAVLMVAGLGVIAAEYGSQSDPLVTLSYIEQVLLPRPKRMWISRWRTPWRTLRTC